MDSASSRAIVLDIEGTIAPVSFVYDVLFPFAKTHAGTFIRGKWGTDTVADIVRGLREQVAADQEAGMRGVVPIAAADAGDDAIRASVIANVEWQMSSDRKTTALKALQGHIWKSGFESGELRSILYPDVPPALEKWKAQGATVAIYSSGSVQAQKLFLGHSTLGDFRHHIDGWFDTTTGPKRHPESYEKIAETLGVPPEQTTFYTDVVAEAEAAQKAGMQAVILDRPGNAPTDPHPFQTQKTYRP